MIQEDTLIALVGLGGVVLLGAVIWFGLTLLVNHIVRRCGRMIRSRFGSKDYAESSTPSTDFTTGATIIQHPAMSATPRRSTKSREPGQNRVVELHGEQSSEQRLARRQHG